MHYFAFGANMSVARMRERQVLCSRRDLNHLLAGCDLLSPGYSAMLEAVETWDHTEGTTGIYAQS